MTATSNQALLVTLVAIIGIVVLVALHDLAAAAGLPVVAGLASFHLGANTTPSAPTTPVVEPVVTPVAGNTAP